MFFSKSYSPVVIFKYKLFDFLYLHFFVAFTLFKIYMITLKKQKKAKKVLNKSLRIIAIIYGQKSYHLKAAQIFESKILIIYNCYYMCHQNHDKF